MKPGGIAQLCETLSPDQREEDADFARFLLSFSHGQRGMGLRKRAAAVLGLLVLLSPGEAGAGWKAGAGTRCITPGEAMWMSGYASRDRPAEGTLTELWAKALALEDEAGRQAVLITLDLVGMDASLSARVASRIERDYGLGRERVALCASHTHSGPVAGASLATMFVLDDGERQKAAEYLPFLEQRIGEAVDQAMAGLEPADVAWEEGFAGFAVNRRNNPESEILLRRTAGALLGPVDHSVPVLRVAREGRIRALVFGYACHATVLNSYQWSGDYPGFAQIALEESYPGAVALFWAGCGADLNPLPRREVELARRYGEVLAASVAEVVEGRMQALRGSIQAGFEEIGLPFARIPSREELQAHIAGENLFEANRARLLLERLDHEGALAASYPYPVQAWKLGEVGPLWLFLGGEVVVDYALRFKRDFGRRGVWATAYANDVMAYIPSQRVLEEGGYEGGGAMVYYGLPSPWQEGVEERIVHAVRRQAMRVSRR